MVKGCCSLIRVMCALSVSTPRAALVLYAPCSVRPALSTVEKKWIAFQLLRALKDSHEQKVRGPPQALAAMLHSALVCIALLIAVFPW